MDQSIWIENLKYLDFEMLFDYKLNKLLFIC